MNSDSCARSRFSNSGDSILLAGLAAVVFGYQLGKPSLWLDEAYSWHTVTGNWQRFWTETTYAEDCGGFLFALLLKFWVMWAGTSEAALRVPAVALGIMAVLLTAGAMRRLGGKSAGVFAGLLLLSHPLMIMYSRQSRAYSLLIMASALILWGLAVRNRAGGDSWNRGDGAVVAGCVLATFSHVFGVFLTFGVLLGTVCEFLSRPGARTPQRLWFSLAVITLCWFGWASLMRRRIQENLQDFWIKKHFLLEYYDLIVFLGPLLLVLLPVGLLVLVVAVARRRFPSERPEHRFILFLVCLTLTISAGPLGVSWLSRGSHHFVNYRYCLALLPILICGYVLMIQMFPRKIQPLLVGLVMLQSIRFFINAGMFQFYEEAFPYGLNARQAVLGFEKYSEPEETLLIFPGQHEMAFRYYGFRSDLPVRPAVMDSAVAGLAERTDFPLSLVVCLTPVELVQQFAPEHRWTEQARWGSMVLFRVERPDSEPDSGP